MESEKEFDIVFAIQTGDIKLFKEKFTLQDVHTLYPKKRTLLHYSCIADQPDISKFLIDNGANIQALDQFQCTPFQYTQLHLHQNIQESLNQIQMEISKDKLESIDMFALIELNQQAQLKEFIKKNKKQGSINNKNMKGRTALHVAAITGSFHITKILLLYKINPNIEDQYGFTALQYAKSLKHKKVCSILSIYNQKSAISLTSNSDEISPKNDKEEHKVEEKVYDVIIVGAGAAGIGAGQICHKFGLDYIILEADKESGGRCKTMQIGDVPIDIGGAWIHSYNKSNPIRNFVEQLKIEGFRKNNCKQYYYDSNGKELLQNDIVYFQNCAYQLEQLAYNNGRKFKQDISMAQSMKDQYDLIYNKCQQEGKQDIINGINFFINKLEHFEAASIDELTSQEFDECKEQGGDFIPQKGYGIILQQLAKKLRIFPNNEVTKIDYQQKDHCIIQTSTNQNYTSKHVICTVSLGILKQNLIQFAPQLPQEKIDAIQNLGMGLMNKIILQFESQFWPIDTQSISIIHQEKGYFPWYINLAPQLNFPVLVCFLTDNFARKMEKEPEEIIIKQALDQLKLVYKDKVSKLINSYVTYWQKNKFTLGSYSFFQVGSSPQHCDNLKKPINNQLVFAGEACYKNNLGTVHGAFQTGIEAAEEICHQLIL